jgi:nicotinamide-nucleotide amidase
MQGSPPAKLTDLGERVGNALAGRKLAVAESFSGGLILHALVATEGSGEWLRGGVVAYDAEVKFSLLGVERGPVVNEETARAMATSVAKLLDADVGLATTGIAGPERVEGQPPGTMWISVATDARTTAEHGRFDGTPGEVCDRGAELALEVLLGALENGRDDPVSER